MTNFFRMRVSSDSILRPLLILIFAAAFSNPASGSQLSRDQMSNLSERALFREYERARSSGDLLYAYEVLKTALENRDAKRGRPNPHKKYTPEFEKLSALLANQAAEEGIQSCRQMDFATCEEKLEHARSFADTPTVQEHERLLESSLEDLRARFAQASSLAANSQFQEALEQLNALEPFHPYLSDYARSKEGIVHRYADSLISTAQSQFVARRWDEAERNLLLAENLRAGDPRVQKGLQTVEKGRDAENLATMASTQLKQKQFVRSADLVESALELLPEASWLKSLKEEAATEWAAHLATEIPGLLRDRLSFPSTRDAWVALTRLSRLEPNHSLIAARSAEARENFGWASLQRALDLMAVEDPHRMATAYALMLNAQLQLGPVRVRNEQVKDAASGFNRKRMSQLVLSVENLCGAPAEFVNAVFARAHHTVEAIGLPDLRIRTREQYLRRPDEDPLFQDVRPQGISSTALLAIGISGYMSERWSSDEPERIESQYVAGTEEVENPEYREKEEELLTLVRSFAGTKKEADRRVLSHRIELAKRELEKIDRTKPVPSLASYSYLKVAHRQESEVDLILTLRDFVTRESISQESITESDRRVGEHIEGVHDQDVQSARNESIRMPTPEQMLGALERQALESLEEKLPDLLRVYVNRFFDEGRRMLEIGRRADAAELFLCHWALFRGDLDKDQLKLVLQTVQEETGLDLERDGPALLSMVERVAPILP